MEEHVSIRYGREAMEAGQHDRAYDHFLYALARSQRPVDVVVFLLENAAAAGDADAHTLWAHLFHSLAADKRGRAKIPNALGKLLPKEDEFPSRLSAARAAAVRELVKFRDARIRSRRLGDGLIAEWSEDLARSLTLESPALWKEYGGGLGPEMAVGPDLQMQVIRALEKITRNGLGIGAQDQVLRAARCLRGLGAQAGFKDLEGPEPPKMSGPLAAANDALGRSRPKLSTEGVRIWTIEELEDLDEDQQRAFTLEHGSFAAPGVALSPNRLYLVETNCGYWTLLGAAQTVEEHHERLVNLYGEDPFGGRQGILRVVPESYGLEMEGSPFWWAGGFQGGDVTTLKFTMGTIPGLGRGITHELTHRFDGAAFGGLPAWLTEGRAVWTGSSYGSLYDGEFVEDHVDFGTLYGVHLKGYGRQQELEELIAGTIEEYRDNYSAGYALFVFLHTWTGFDPHHEMPLFAGRLQEYMENRKRSKGGAVAGFAKYFADGKDGRPEDMEAFAADFDRFLKGFYWKDQAAWVVRYDPSAPRGDAAEMVPDEPTFTWLRRRAEPWFGQDQARIAAELLDEVGNPADAIVAYRWSLAVDEPSDGTLSDLVACLEDQGLTEASWVVRRWPRFSSPLRDQRMPVVEPAPFLAKLPKVQELLALRAEAVQDLQSRGLDFAASAMAADHDGLASLLGLQLLQLDPPEEGALHPFTRPGSHLTLSGWEEDGLTGFEEERVVGNWFEDHRADLHVGRKEARTGTDTMDRAAYRSDIFVRSGTWQEPGRYRLRAKIEQTTEFYSAGVVFGWTRRDRNLRFGFSGGDYRYAIRESDAREANHGFRWSLDGLYARRGAKSGSVGFDRRKTTWELEILVDGPTAEVRVDGKAIGFLTTQDARPIQGYIGFTASTGAVRVIQPQVERLDRERFLPDAPSPGRGLNPHRSGTNRMRDFIGRPVTGLPLSGAGTALIWISEESRDHRAEMVPGDWKARIIDVLTEFLVNWAVDAPVQGITVVLPDSIPPKERDELIAHFATPAEEFELPRGELQWAHHTRELDVAERGMTVGGWVRPLLGFVDPAGILRYHGRLSQTRFTLPREFRALLQEFQDHARPGQAGSGD